MKRLISPTDYKFQDYQISYDSLEAMEKVDSGNLDSLVLHNNQNYDFVSDMRYDTTAPNQYEVSVDYNGVYKMSSKKRLITAEEEVENSIPDMNVSSYEDNQEDDQPEEEIEEEIHTEDKIPNYLVFDALKQATDEVTTTLNQNIKKAPVPVDIYIRYDNLNDPDNYTTESQVAFTDYIDTVYTIYQIFLQDINVYVIITADRLTKDHKFYEWENVVYNGFYATRQEAVDYIKSCL